MTKKPNTIVTTGMILQGDTAPMLLFKVLQIERGGLGFVESDGGGAVLEYQYSVVGFDISTINPLATLGVDKLERSKHFADHFVPLNSVIQVVVIPDSPSKIDAVNTNIITKLDSAEDLVEKGWFFTSTSYDSIDARFLFGSSNIVNAEELVMELSAWDMQGGNDSFSIESIKTGIQNTEEQYVILAVIIIAAIGATIFYLKGYKRNR